MANNFFNIDNDDFLTTCDKTQDLKIRTINPKKGMWANLRNEFGDVWHEIEKVYEPDNYYASAYIYDRVDSKSPDSKLISVHYHRLRNVVEELPNNARVVMSKEGTKRIL